MKIYLRNRIMIWEEEMKSQNNGMRNLYFPADLILNEFESAVNRNYPELK